MPDRSWTEHEMREADVNALATWVDELREQVKNREAEIEGLERERAGDDLAIEEFKAEIKRLQAEQRFREAEAEWVERFQTLEAENDRLRAVIRAAATEPTTHPDVAAALLRASCPK